MKDALENTRSHLLAERNAAGYWEGELSSSALSTATAIVALSVIERERFAGLIGGGLKWLEENQNGDGGWGDTVLSFSNISTTLLCWGALGFCDGGDGAAEKRAEAWVLKEVGSLEPGEIAEKVKARYGKDRTFSVPILMLCAICGRLGDPREAWQRVLPLPFEVAAIPRRFFGAIRLPVVSYALPALIAIGYARYFNAPPRLLKWLRKLAWPKASRMLASVQPSSGGFLEATPLTSFVTMALGSSGQAAHPVVPGALEFLQRSVRADGSWPIDSNLATWGTTLSVKALAASGGFPEEGRARVLKWLLDQQYREVHPFTDAKPGGWAWTDLPGGVPDADDTPGALLAIYELGRGREDCRLAAQAGVRWLLDLQNRDGGIPTFCRGWGALPFDRSSQDLTAHTLRAWVVWRDQMPEKLRALIDRGMRRGLRYLEQCQDDRGAWEPLWFGNQHVAGEQNLTYATAHVLLALAELDAIEFPSIRAMREAGISWLRSTQRGDGGWGGDAGSPASIEETSLAISALAGFGIESPAGMDWLLRETNHGREFNPSPVGFYFAKLWYYERLYPQVWALEALGRASSISE
ncbi:MAG: squalene-hopene/tetraprenyl-beta-curcumene cyclase [Verrucomicrobiales bacterium]|jgi:squalene-hopene/tetraprenyl-beta-curcumene cyclase